MAVNFGKHSWSYYQKAGEGMHGDGGGLWLQVRGGGRSWLFRWTDRRTKKERIIGLGSMSAFDIAAARERARECRQWLAGGKDPEIERRNQRADEEIRAGQAKTVREVADEFYDVKIRFNSQSDRRHYLSITGRHVLPHIGDMPIAKVTAADLLDRVPLRELWGGPPHIRRFRTAQGLLSYLRRIMSYAIEKGYCGHPKPPNPLDWESLKHILPERRRVHQTRNLASLKYEEVGRFMRELRAYRAYWGDEAAALSKRNADIVQDLASGLTMRATGLKYGISAQTVCDIRDRAEQRSRRRALWAKGEHPTIALLVEFLVLSGVRMSEARLATWDEMQGLNGPDPAVWVIPWEHHKIGSLTGRPHLVPITGPMLAVLDEMRQRAGGEPDGVVFPSPYPARSGPRTPKYVRPFGHTSPINFLHRLKWDVHITNHGFRSTFTDWARAQNKYTDALIDLQLGHIPHGQVNQAYKRDQLVEIRRPMMETWGKFCNLPPADDTRVVNLEDRRSAS